MNFQEISSGKTASLIEAAKSTIKSGIDLYADCERVIFIREEAGVYRTVLGFRNLSYRKLNKWRVMFEQGTVFNLEDLPICKNCKCPHNQPEASLCDPCEKKLWIDSIDFECGWGGIPDMFSITDI